MALTRSVLTTTHPQVGWAEQDPLRWWTSVVIACAESRAQAPAAFGRVDVVVCSGARQTFVPVSAVGRPDRQGHLVVRPAWRGRGAGPHRGARGRGHQPGPDRASRSTPAPWRPSWPGWPRTSPARLSACDVILSPRDFVLRRMTDEVVTDVTFASRSGLYDFDGNAVRELAGPALGKLPSVVPSDTVVGHLKAVPGAELGLRPGTPVVIGAGDRQCEVLGSGASEECPMVSWGTTANVSVPVHERPVPSPAGAVVTRGRQRRLVARGRPLGRRLLPGLAGPAARPARRRAGGAGGEEPARARVASPRCRGSTAPGRPGGVTTPGPASSAWAPRTAWTICPGR